VRDAFGISKDWWEAPPPKEKHVISRGESAAIGTAAGVGLGAGALYLATRGKAKPKTKVVERVVNLKPKKTPDPPKTPAPEPSEPLIPLTPPHPSREQIGRQRKINLQRIAEHDAKKPVGPPQPPDARVKAPVEYDSKLSMKEVDAAADAKYGTDDEILSGQAKRASRRAKAQMHGKPGRNPRVAKADYDILANRAKMDIVDELVFKALTGEKGDKRNTKYALVGGAGYLVGANTGDRIGAKMAGTTLHENRAKTRMKMSQFVADEKSKLPPEQRAKYMVPLKDLTRIGNKVKGTKQIVRGSAIGAGVGAATTAGAYALYRNDKKRRLVSKKDTKGMDAKKGALLGAGAGMAAGNVVGIPAAGMAAAMSGKKSSSKTFVRSLTRFNRSALVLVPAGLGAGLGALAGKGAKDTREKLSKAEIQMLAKREAVALL
jgi:hypothetical protein